MAGFQSADARSIRVSATKFFVPPRMLVGQQAVSKAATLGSNPGRGATGAKLIRMSRRLLIVRQRVRFPPRLPSFLCGSRVGSRRSTVNREEKSRRWFESSPHSHFMKTGYPVVPVVWPDRLTEGRSSYKALTLVRLQPGHQFFGRHWIC